MVKKIKDCLFFNYGLDVPIKYIWLILILLSSVLLLFFSLLFRNASIKTTPISNENIPIGQQIPGAPPGVLFVNPPVLK